MCISPNLLRDGTQVGCRKCWQCQEQRVDNWVGRCIAESRTAAVSVFVTLTYGRDADGNESHERAAILTYSDVQKYFMTLRKRGFRFRYMVVGEIGSLKGRAHWHVIIFFEDPLPATITDYGRNAWHREKRETPVEVPIVWFKRFNEPMWPHGFSQWDRLSFGYEQGGLRYACKYINKDIDDAAAQSKLAMSKRPPLGAVYFDKRAKKLVDEGVSPQDPYYTFPNQARRKNGEVIRFKLAGRSLELFCENYVRRWLGFPPYLYQGPPTLERGPIWPHSDLIEEHLDKETRKEVGDYESATLEARIRPAKRWPFAPPMGFADIDIHWSDHGPMVKTSAGPLWYGPNENGVNAWRNDVPKSVWTPVQQKRPIYREPPAQLTQWGWVNHLSAAVYWLTQSSQTIGRYKLAKQPSNGRKRWMQSLGRASE